MKKTTFTNLCWFGFFAAGFDLLVLVFLTILGRPAHSSRPTRVASDFNSIGAALSMYAINAGRVPTTAQGLEALVIEPKAAPLPVKYKPLMTRVPRDPWGTCYRYACLGEWSWRITSAGSDLTFGTEDDLNSDDM